MYRPLDQVSHDLRFALRQFRRAPGLTFAAVLALACGIGGMTTVFTLVDAVVLRPLPVSAPDELVWLRDPSFSYPMFEQMRDRAHMLRGVFAWEPRTLQAEWTSEPEPTSMVLVTGAFHDTLGLQPAAGRLLNQADVGNTAAEAQAVAVLSHAAWQRRFSGDHCGDRPHASHRRTALHDRRRHAAGILRCRGRDVAGRDHPGDDAPASAER